MHLPMTCVTTPSYLQNLSKPANPRLFAVLFKWHLFLDTRRPLHSP